MRPKCIVDKLIDKKMTYWDHINKVNLQLVSLKNNPNINLSSKQIDKINDHTQLRIENNQLINPFIKSYEIEMK